MNTFKKSVLTAAIATTGVVGLTAGSVAQAEVSASVGIANIYFWRGYDLSQQNGETTEGEEAVSGGGGAPAVSGSLDYSHESGIYAGIWGSSGDETYGTEYDLYIGYGGSIGEDFTYDISFWDYNYPDTGNGADLQEFSIGLGYGAFGYYVMIPEDSDADYYYHNFSADLGSGFSAALGHWTGDDVDGSHLDLTYTLSDVSFTISQSSGDDYPEDVQFVVAYSLPLEM